MPIPELRAAEKMYPAIVDDPDYGRPHYSRADGYWWNPGIVHAPESARFTEIFRTAPVWLLQFTRIRLDASVLEFDLPDISAELVWGVEGVKDAERWPQLPLGTMAAGDPVCIAPEEFGSDLSPEERRFYQEMKHRPEEEWSRRAAHDVSNSSSVCDSRNNALLKVHQASPFTDRVALDGGCAGTVRVCARFGSLTHLRGVHGCAGRRSRPI